MKLETALKGAVAIPRAFHSKQGRKLQKGVKREVSKGFDVHGHEIHSFIT